MTIIQQPTLFDIDILETLDIQEKYQEIFSPVQMHKLVNLFSKNTTVGHPVDINYAAVIRSIMARFYEKIDTQKALISRLNSDLRFKLSLGFLYSEPVPSEATYSRVMKTLSQNLELLEEINVDFLQIIQDEFDIFEENVAYDATAIEARTKHKKTENPRLPATQDQRKMSTEEILATIPTYPSWGVKKNSKGKNTYWFGYKATLAVTTQSQYILQMLISSAFTADVSVVIPVIRKTHELTHSFKTEDHYHEGKHHGCLDKGYDAQAIYEEMHEVHIEPIIDMKQLAENDGEIDENCAPTCLLEYGYSYDSYDKRYNALKYIRPEAHCRECPLRNEGLCQKVIKIKQETSSRMYNRPARGTLSWQKIYNQRSSVERVNAYLKDSYQLNQTRFYKHKHAHAEFLLMQLAYNAKTFATQRLNKKNKKEIAA